MPGATGWIDTNYSGKAEFALKALEHKDFVYVHVEAPDEAGHSGSLEHKVMAIEDLDSKLIGPVLAGMKERFGEFRMLVMPDHATPLKARTHTAEPVPFVIYDNRRQKDNAGAAYNEAIAAGSDSIFIEKGHTLMDKFIKEALG